MGWTVYNSDGKILQSAELGDNAVTSAKIAAGAIVAADINAQAAIEFSQMENLTTGRALVTDGNGDILVSGVTTTELELLDGLTSSTAELNLLDGVSGLVQADLTKLAAIDSTAAEVNLLNGVSGLVQADLTKLAAIDATAAEIDLLDGVSGLVQADFTKLAAVDSSAAELNLLDALDRGSILYGNASGVTAVLGQGSADQVLTSDGDDIAWATPGGVPSGAILMWHGLIANIPTGWVLCNGSNSTPDLRGQFIQGAANGVEAGATGGSATAAPAAHSNHSVTQPSTHAALASHAHATNHGTWSTHRHGFARGGAGYGTSTSFTITARSYYNYQSVSTGAGGMLTESIAAGTPNAHSGTAVDAHSAHSTSDSRPPFYTILYIMKS